MRLLLVLLVVISFSFVVLAQGAKRVQVELLSIDKYINTHVGHEYEYYATINDKEIRIGDTRDNIVFRGYHLGISCFAKDVDPYFDDTSYNEKLYSWKELNDGTFKIKIRVIVTENRGRYSGETSTFDFNFKMQVLDYGRLNDDSYDQNARDENNSQSIKYLKGDAIVMIEYFFNDLNEKKYQKAYQRCDNKLWIPFTNFMKAWNDLSNIQIESHEYINRQSRYEPEEVITVTYTGISNSTGDRVILKHDFLTKTIGGDLKIIRLLFPR